MKIFTKVKVINFFLFGFIISIYSYVPIIIYMLENDFFSYDFFSEQGFYAIFIFKSQMLFFLLAISGYTLLGIVLSIVAKVLKQEITCCKIYVRVLLVINFVVIIIFILAGFTDIIDSQWIKNEYYLWVTFIFLVSLIISIHFSIVILTDDIKKYLSSIVVSFLFILPFVFFMFSKQTALLVSIPLKAFGTGGNISVKIKDVNNANIYKNGELILLSPENIYFKTTENNVLILKRNNYLIEIERKK